MIDDDPFEYDDDGKPRGVRAPVIQTNLTESELHDVAMAASAANEFEAIALVEALEEAGIPAMKHSGLIHFGPSGPSEIMVPRKLLDAARKHVESFRSAATERGVEAAFKPENIEEQWNDRKQDPLVLEMMNLAHLPLDQRRQKLIDHVMDWIADGSPLPEMANRLAAVGLDRHEAEQLIETVKVDLSGKVIERLEDRCTKGVCLACIGAALTMGTYLIGRSQINGPGIIIYFSPMMFLGGLFMALHAKSKLDEIRKK